MDLINRDILSRLDTTEPAPDQLIRKAQVQLSAQFPPDYLEFIALSDGAEGDARGQYLQLWPLKQVLESQAAYQVTEFAPGLLLFGSDGGGEAFGFDCRSVPWKVVQIPFIPLDWEDARVVADSFAAFLEWANTVT
jgi:cell wall assembly regulator SMI1